MTSLMGSEENGNLPKKPYPECPWKTTHELQGTNKCWFHHSLEKEYCRIHFYTVTEM